MSELKDVAMANSIMEMAELGRFDKSLSAYGFVYWEKKRGCVYCLSSKQNIITERMNDLRLKGLLPSHIYMKNRAIPNYAGSSEPEESKLKLDLAKELKQKFNEKELYEISSLAEVKANDIAASSMLAWKDELIGTFDQDQLQLYLQTLNYFYTARKLRMHTYEFLKQWVLREISQIHNELLTSGEGKKTFWGFAASKVENINWKYYIDANLTAITEQENRMRLDGKMVTPLFKKTLFIEPGQAPYTLRAPFLEDMKTNITLEYLEFFEFLWRAQSPISTVKYRNVANQLEYEESVRLLGIYSSIWGVF